MQGMSRHQQIPFMAEYNNRRKSKGVAYIWAILLGGLCAHRFYRGEVGYAFGLIAYYALFWPVWLERS
jgi:TM2 domain-containing membrane protein YozV